MDWHTELHFLSVIIRTHILYLDLERDNNVFLSNGFLFTFITQLIACEQALRGSLAAGQEKGEAEHATLCSKRLDFLQSVNSFFFFWDNDYYNELYQ